MTYESEPEFFNLDSDDLPFDTYSHPYFNDYDSDYPMDLGISPQDVTKNSSFPMSNVRGTRHDNAYIGNDKHDRHHFTHYGNTHDVKHEQGPYYAGNANYGLEPWDSIDAGHHTLTVSEYRSVPHPMVKQDSTDSSGLTIGSTLGSYTDDTRSFSNLSLVGHDGSVAKMVSPSTSPRQPRRKGAASARHASVASSYEEEPNLYCHHPECMDPQTGFPKKRYSRKADVERHRKTEHEPAGFPCPMRRCHRKGSQSFSRKDHLTEHLRGTHGQVIPKGRGSGDRKKSLQGNKGIKEEYDGDLT